MSLGFATTHHLPLHAGTLRSLSRTRRTFRCEASGPRVAKESGSTRKLVLASALALVIATNRIAFTETLYGTQSRSDLLGLATAGLVALLGLSRAQVKSKVKQQVEPIGQPVDFVNQQLDALQQQELVWAADILMQVTNVCSVLVVSNGYPLLQRGVGGDSAQPYAAGEIVDAAFAAGKRTYMADMNVVLRKSEFTYLPANIQAVLIQPLDENSAIILGTDKARCFVGQDFGWMQAVFNRVATSVQSVV